jgi:hypothetical protein
MLFFKVLVESRSDEVEIVAERDLFFVFGAILLRNASSEKAKVFVRSIHRQLNN